MHGVLRQTLRSLLVSLMAAACAPAAAPPSAPPPPRVEIASPGAPAPARRGEEREVPLAAPTAPFASQEMVMVEVGAPDPGDGNRTPCKGASFDFDALPRECNVKSADSPKLGDFLIALDLAAKKTISGGDTIDAVLTFTNATGQDQPFEFEGCAFFDLYVYSGNRRVDQIYECGGPGGGGCGTGMTRLTVEPKGVVRKRLSVVANSNLTKKSFGQFCETRVTPLRGRYELGVHIDSSFIYQQKVAKVRRAVVIR